MVAPAVAPSKAAARKILGLRARATDRLQSREASPERLPQPVRALSYSSHKSLRRDGSVRMLLLAQAALRAERRAGGQLGGRRTLPAPLELVGPPEVL